MSPTTTTTVQLLLIALLLVLNPRPPLCRSKPTSAERKFHCLAPRPGGDNILCNKEREDENYALKASIELLGARLKTPQAGGFSTWGSYYHCTSATYQAFETYGYAYCRFNDANFCRRSLTDAWDRLIQQCGDHSVGGQITTEGFYSCVRFEMYDFCRSN